MASQGVRFLYCERFACAPAEYPQRMLGHCLYWHARLLAPFFRILSPGYFADDLAFVQRVGLATDPSRVEQEISSFQYSNRTSGSWWRRGLRIRASGRKAAGLARRLLADEGEPAL